MLLKPFSDKLKLDYETTFSNIQPLRRENTYAPADSTGFKSRVIARALDSGNINKIASEDTAWALLSVLFVFLYFIFHLRSLFLAVVGITIVLFSFPLTIVICKGIFQVYYISQLHMLMIFIVLGIAADDIFVFIDAWR